MSNPIDVTKPTENLAKTADVRANMASIKNRVVLLESHATGGLAAQEPSLAAATDGQVPVYDEGTGTWLPGAGGGGGAGLEDKDRNTLQVIEFALFS